MVSRATAHRPSLPPYIPAYAPPSPPLVALPLVPPAIALQQVEWNEINAAWGHAALLLHTIARMRKVQWTKHTVVPMGSFSTVEPGRYELYGGAPVFWASTRFDKAMVGFLFCLNEVLKEVHNAQVCTRLSHGLVVMLKKVNPPPHRTDSKAQCMLGLTLLPTFAQDSAVARPKLAWLGLHSGRRKTPDVQTTFRRKRPRSAGNEHFPLHGCWAVPSTWAVPMHSLLDSGDALRDSWLCRPSSRRR